MKIRILSICKGLYQKRISGANLFRNDLFKMLKAITIGSLVILGLLLGIVSSSASATTYYAANGAAVSRAEYKTLEDQQSADLQELLNVLNGDGRSQKNFNTEQLVAETDPNAVNTEEEGECEGEECEEDDEYYEDDEEFDDTVVDINDPLFAINYTFFNINDILYTVVFKPAAQTYNVFIPVEFRTVISNFFL